MPLDITGTEQIGDEENTAKNVQNWSVTTSQTEHVTGFLVKGSVLEFVTYFLTLTM